jgi:predicted nucleotide-binding protein
MRCRVLFQGSHVIGGRRMDPPVLLSKAQLIATALGDALIRADLDLILTGYRNLDMAVGTAAVAACRDLGVDPKERIRTYPSGGVSREPTGFGMVLRPKLRRWQDLRTFLVREAHAVVALTGGKGTADVLQKAELAGKKIFPIAVAGGAAQEQWDRLRQVGYHNYEQGDIDFLADVTLDTHSMARYISDHCRRITSSKVQFSRRIFIVHGHDDSLKSELARFLAVLGLSPVILHEQPDEGRTIIAKLQSELADVGFAFVLLTPDDLARPGATNSRLKPRARQNVIFEHGLLFGLLGPSRVCAIARGDVEFPSDLNGVLYKRVPKGERLSTIALDIIGELRKAGYEVDANSVQL